MDPDLRTSLIDDDGGPSALESQNEELKAAMAISSNIVTDELLGGLEHQIRKCVPWPILEFRNGCLVQEEYAVLVDELRIFGIPFWFSVHHLPYGCVRKYNMSRSVRSFWPTIISFVCLMIIAFSSLTSTPTASADGSSSGGGTSTMSIIAFIVIIVTWAYFIWDYFTAPVYCTIHTNVKINNAIGVQFLGMGVFTYSFPVDQEKLRDFDHNLKVKCTGLFMKDRVR